MKKKVLFISIIILFIVGCGKVFASSEEVESNLEYSIMYDNRWNKLEGITTEDMTLEGVKVLECFDISSYEMLKLKYSYTLTDQYRLGYYFSQEKPTNSYTLEYIDDVIFKESEDVVFDIGKTSYNYFSIVCYVNVFIYRNQVFNRTIVYDDLSITGFTEYEIVVSGDSYYETYDDEYLNVDELVNSLSVVDFESENINYEITDNYTTSYDILGEHSIIVRFYDDLGNEAYYTIIVNVLESSVPKIEFELEDTIFDIDEAYSLDELESFFKGYDKEDLDITSNIEFESNYNNEIIGDYYIKAYVYDSSNYYKELIVNISVKDYKAPTLENTHIDIGSDRLYEIDELINLMGISDNYREFSYKVISNNYKNEIGEYSISLELYDESDNMSSYSVILNVYDSTCPVIEASNISVTNNRLMDLEEISKYIKVYDDSSIKSLIINIEEYTSNYDKAGTYSIYVEAIDDNDLKSELIFEITVTENNKPIIFYNDIIEISKDSIVSRDELIMFLRDISVNSYSSEDISVVNSSYFIEPNKIGEHTVKITTTLKDGSEIKEEYTINVVDENKGSENNKKKQGGFSNFFKKIGRKFKKFFSSIFMFCFR